MGVVYGLVAAVLFGSGDYLGGRASSGVDVKRVLFVSQVTAALVAIVAVIVAGGHSSARDLAYGAGAGAFAAVGLGLLYRALSIGRAGVVAPMTAVVGAIVPVTWGIARGERPGGVAMAGVAVAIAAAALIAAGNNHDLTGSSGMAMAVAAGAAFGVGFVCYATASEGSGLWPLLSARAAAIIVILGALALTRGRSSAVALGARRTRLAVAAGAFDVAGTISLIAGVRTEFAVLVAAVTALAPAFTVIWSWLLLHERLGRSQALGVALALAGLVAIATG